MAFKVTVANLRAARHNSNFQDLLLDFIEERTTPPEEDDEDLIARYGEPKAPEVPGTATQGEASETSTPNT